MVEVLYRPLKCLVEEGEAYLVVSASIDQADSSASLDFYAQNDADATMAVLNKIPSDFSPPGLVIPIAGLAVKSFNNLYHNLPTGLGFLQRGIGFSMSPVI